jgi:thiol:disulfide interchange protein DsbA
MLVALGAVARAAPLTAQTFDIRGKFKPIRPLQLPETPEGTVEVIDIFGYRCPHCFRFLPIMQRYEQTKPDYVHIRHLPVIFRKSWEKPARAYYTAELLGVVEKVHRPIFEALHVKNRPMKEDAAWRALFVAQGVSGEDFDNTFRSFAVESLLRKSTVMQGRYGISSTPSVVVHGKYLVGGSLAGSMQNIIKVVEGLVELEHKAQPASG